MWVVMGQKPNQFGGYEAPVIVGQKVYTDAGTAEWVSRNLHTTGGWARAHAYVVELKVTD